MRRKDREQNSQAFMAQVLAEAEEICVAFNTGAAPHVLFLNFAHCGNSIYVHCAVEGRKLDCIRKDNRVGFTAAAGVQVIPEKFATRFRSVCGHGRAVLLEEAEARQAALVIIGDRYAAACPRPVPEAMLARTLAIRIDIEEMTGKESLGK